MGKFFNFIRNACAGGKSQLNVTFYGLPFTFLHLLEPFERLRKTIPNHFFTLFRRFSGYVFFNDIYAGQVVQVNIGDARAGGNNELDPLYSGNYIVTGLRHKIDKNKYEVVMEVSKDSF